jgi:hypothetical protein
VNEVLAVLTVPSDGERAAARKTQGSLAGAARAGMTAQAQSGAEREAEARAANAADWEPLPGMTILMSTQARPVAAPERPHATPSLMAIHKIRAPGGRS